MMNLPCPKMAYMCVRTAGYISAQNKRLLCVSYRFWLVYYASIMCVLLVSYDLILTPSKSILGKMGKKKRPFIYEKIYERGKGDVKIV